MIKVVVPLLTFFLTLGVTGCDLSMNKNKSSTKEMTDQKTLHTPITEEQQSININDVAPSEPSYQVKQAETWQDMNLATSTNENGASIDLKDEIDQEQQKNFTTTTTHEPTIEDYFADLKPAK